MSSEKKSIKYQLSELDEQLFEQSEKLIKIKIAPGAGIYEEIRVGDDDVTLECIMTWNTGSFNYEIPANNLIKLLKSKPFDLINSEDLNEFDYELIKVEDGDLDYKKINDIDIENEKEIIESLKNSKYEIDINDDDEDKYHEIEEQMRALYSNGDIYDSKYNFEGLFSLEFDDDEFGNYYVDWHYSKNLFTNAKTHFNNSDYEKSIEILQKYIVFEDKKEEIIDGLRLIAESYEKLKDYNNAIHFYDEVIKLDPANDFYYAHKGYCLNKNQKYLAADEAFKKAVDLNPSNIWAYMSYGDALNEQEKYNEAIDIYNEGIEKNPIQPQDTTSLFWLHHLKGHIYFENFEDWEKAAKSYDKAIEIGINQNMDKETYGVSYRRAGSAYYDLDEYDSAIDRLVKSQQCDDTYKDVYTFYFIGESYRFTKSFDLAIKAFEQSVAFEECEVHPYSYRSMAYCALQIGNFENCVEYSEKGNQDGWNLYNCGKALIKLKRYTSAAYKLQKALELEPDDKWYNHEKGKAEFYLAQSGIKGGNYEFAIKSFDKVLTIDSKYKWSLQFKGDAHFELEQYDQALEAYERMNEIDDYFIFQNSNTTTQLLQNITLCYHYKGQFDKAMLFYKEDNGYYFRKESLWWHYCKKTAEINQKGDLFTTPKEVKQLEDKTIEKIKDKQLLSKIYLSRGSSDIYYYEGENKGKIKLDLMISDLNKSIECDAKNYMAYLIRASYTSNFFSESTNASYHDVLEKDKELIDLNHAIEDLKVFINAENNVNGDILLIRCYSKLNDLENFENACEIAVSKFASEAKLWSWIGDEWKKNKQYEKSLNAYKKASALKLDSAYYLCDVGEVYLHLNDSKNAISAFKQSIEINSDNEMFRYWLSRAYLADNQVDLAFSEINNTISSYSGDKDYFIQYAKVCGEKYKDNYPKIGELMLEYINITSPHNSRSDESKKKHKAFLDVCDSFNAGHCNAFGLKLSESEIKLADKNMPVFFELWDHFLEEDIQHYLEKGSYMTQYHLSKNKNLTKEQVLGLLNKGSFSILENAAANTLIDLEDIKIIIDSDDESYNYSYKLLGVLSNPNIDSDSIEKLKNNKYSWVRKKVFSKINNYDEIDLGDKYKIQGLIENSNLDTKIINKLTKLLPSLTSEEYKIKFLTERVSLSEYVLGEHEIEEIAPKICESIQNGDESWEEYCGSDWHQYGESEYGMEDTSIDLLVSLNGQKEAINLFAGNRETDHILENYSDSLTEGNFIHIADSGETGEYVFNEFSMEFEFRPEEINFEVTDYQLLISGIDYLHPNGEDYNYSAGELVETRTKGTDITLYYKTNNELIDVTYYEEILDKIDPENKKQNVNEVSIKDYFEFLKKR